MSIRRSRKNIPQLIDRSFNTRPNMVDTSKVFLKNVDISKNYIINMNKITCLFSITKNSWNRISMYFFEKN